MVELPQGGYEDSPSKGYAGNPILNTLKKATSAITQHARDQQVSAYNCRFVSILQSYDCMLGTFH